MLFERRYKRIVLRSRYNIDIFEDNYLDLRFIILLIHFSSP